MFNIVLVTPEIPPNTGNVIRSPQHRLPTAFDRAARLAMTIRCCAAPARLHEYVTCAGTRRGRVSRGRATANEHLYAFTTQTRRAFADVRSEPAF